MAQMLIIEETTLSIHTRTKRVQARLHMLSLILTFTDHQISYRLKRTLLMAMLRLMITDRGSINIPLYQIMLGFFLLTKSK